MGQGELHAMDGDEKIVEDKEETDNEGTGSEEQEGVHRTTKPARNVTFPHT